MDGKPLPRITPDSRPFWEGCAAGELRLQHCVTCDHLQFPPRARCLGCGAVDLRWSAVAPRGEVHSFTVVHRAPSAAFRDDVPYVLALVDVVPGARLMVNVVDCHPDDVHIGMPVTIGFQERREHDRVAWIPLARPSREGVTRG